MIVSTLFLLKQRTQYPVGYDEYDSYSGTMVGYGLYNSALNVVNMLNNEGIPSELSFVVDANAIDSVVRQKQPTHVIIEAVWVLPSKFDELIPLHPNVSWIIRVHSETPFLANEGYAFDRLFGYLERQNVYVAFNSKNIFNEFRNLVSEEKSKRVIYLPNYYEGSIATVLPPPPTPGTINIGCFGAIRPMKNHLIQAVAAIDFANENNLQLRFHINGTRIEQLGQQVLNNLRGLFAQFPQHELVEHPWMNHNEFVNLVASMDICMQVSLSETFNIVTADAVINNVPVVGSKEIGWINWLFQADPNLSKSIKTKLIIAKQAGVLGTKLNKVGLSKYNYQAKKLWKEFLRVL